MILSHPALLSDRAARETFVRHDILFPFEFFAAWPDISYLA
jgi:hypothetical protein